VNPHYTNINAATQEKDSNSCLNYFRNLLKLRAAQIPVIVYGRYTLIDKTNPNVFAYTRENGKEKLLVLLNFSTSNARVVPALSQKPELLLSNYKQIPLLDKTRTHITLKPYQAAIYKL
jgi:oligo-1,6-glucosidase